MTPQQFLRLKDVEQQLDALISLVTELDREIVELKESRHKVGRPRKQDDERQAETPT
jgi:hypothetical protein